MEQLPILMPIISWWVVTAAESGISLGGKEASHKTLNPV